MIGETLWNKITFDLYSSEKELPTKTGLWFKVLCDENKLYVEKATKHTPSSKLSMQRSITKKEFLFVYSYYDRLVSGEIGIKHEASIKSRNTAYIFALIDKYIE